MNDANPVVGSWKPTGRGTVYADPRPDRTGYIGKLRLRDSGGRLRTVTRNAPTKREARSRLDEVQQRYLQGADLNAQIPTVGEHINDWMERVAPKKCGPKTLDIYAGLIKNHIAPALGNIPLDELRPEHVEAFLDTEARAGRSASTISKYRSILGRATRWALARRLITWDPVAVAETPIIVAQPREGRALTRDEARALIAATADHRMAAWFVLALTIGARPSELGALTWDDVDLEKGTVAITKAIKWHRNQPTVGTTKTGDPRVVDMPPAAIDALKTHRRQQTAERLASRWPVEWDGLIFRSETGTPLDLPNLRRLVAKMARAAGIDRLTPYDLRRSCVSLLSDAGVPLEQVRDVVGHKDTRVTLRHYRRIIRPSISAAAGPMDTLLSATQ